MQFMCYIILGQCMSILALVVLVLVLVLVHHYMNNGALHDAIMLNCYVKFPNIRVQKTYKYRVDLCIIRRWLFKISYKRKPSNGWISNCYDQVFNNKCNLIIILKEQ